MALRFDASNKVSYEKLSNGRLRVKATFSRVGSLRYQRSDGTAQEEIVTADELFNEDSLNTAALAPVTLGHPPEGFVTPDRWRKYAVGASGSKIVAHRDSGLVDVVFVVGDEEAIAAIESGKARQVSAGYSTQVINRDGKLYQTNRTYDHLAIVERGRAGGDVCLHLDSADADDWAFQCDAEGETEAPEKTGTITAESNQRTDSSMKTFRLDGVDYEIPPEVATHLAALQTKADSAIADKARADALQAEVEKLKTEAAQKLDAAQVASEAAARLDAWEAVKPFLGEGAKFDASKSPSDYKLEALTKAYPTLKFDGEVAIATAFDVLRTTRSDTATNTAATKALDAAAVGGDRTDSDDARYDEDMKAVKEMYSQRWKKRRGMKNDELDYSEVN